MYIFEDSKTEIGRLARYCIIGLLGSGFGVFISWNLHEIYNFSELTSVGISVVILYFLYFFSVRSFVFKTRHNLLNQAFRYLIVSFVMRSMEYSLFLLFFYMSELYYLVSYSISIALIFIVKYFVHKHLVFDVDRKS
jgi:putative flippase GtrA